MAVGDAAEKSFTPMARGGDIRAHASNADSLSEIPPAPTPLQEPAPMLEVHPLHEAIHTWKGFFIHIATIVVGLLIAISLERTVEYIHHRQQLRDARDELSREVQDNRRILAKNTDAVKKFKTVLDADMALLRAAQTSRAPAIAKLDYSWGGIFWPQDGAWQALSQNGSFSLMAHEELKKYTYAYSGIHAFMEAGKALAAQMDMAGSIAQRSPDGTLLPADIQNLIAATSECQGKLAYATRVLQIEEFGLETATRPISD